MAVVILLVSYVCTLTYISHVSVVNVLCGFAGSRNFRAKETFAGTCLGLGLGSLAQKFTGEKVLTCESSLGTKVP